MMLQMHGPLLPVLLLVLSTTTAAQSIQSSTVFRFGGQFEERAQGLAVLPNGDFLITGYTNSADLPCSGTFHPTHHNPLLVFDYDQWQHADGYVARFDGSAQHLQWCSYLGGSGEDRAYQLVVDSDHLFVIGITDSDDFDAVGGTPTVGHSMFLSKIALDGQTLVYTILIDGDGEEWIRNGVAATYRLDGRAEALYLAGYSESSTLAGSVLRGTRDGMVFRVDAATGSVTHSLRVGGSGADRAWGGVAVGSGGDIFVAGDTTSTDLLTTHLDPPTAAAMAQSQFGGYDPGQGDWAGDAFVARLSPLLDQVRYITYLGGSRHENASVNGALVVDALDRAYLLVDTRSINLLVDTTLTLPGPGAEKLFHYPPVDLGGNPLTGGAAYDDGLYDGVLLLLSADGRQVLASTVIGGFRMDETSGIALDEHGQVWVTGNTNSNQISTTADALQSHFTPPAGPPQYPWFLDSEFGPDWLISAYSPDLATVTFRSYLGGDGHALTGDAGRSVRTHPGVSNQVWLSGVTDTAPDAAQPIPTDISVGPFGLPSDAIAVHLKTFGYQNQLPAVDAGADQVVPWSGFPMQLQLSGQSSDGDGLLVHRWTTISRPVGAVEPIFSAATQVVTDVSLVTPGDYLFRLSVSDALHWVYDEVLIRADQEGIFADGFEAQSANRTSRTRARRTY